MHLLRNLVFIEAYHGFQLVLRYINTHVNHIEDDLSRDRVLSFLSKAPQASPRPVPVPQHLISFIFVLAPFHLTRL